MNSDQRLSRASMISAMFLVAGTCIGGGMLALPIATGMGGFLPSIFIMIICWLAMTLSALLLLEVSLWMEEGVHIITMTSRLLGIPGKLISWCLYLFICYASLVAYTAGGGLQIAQTFAISKELGALLFILFFGAIIDFGTKIVGRVNTVFFIAMVIAYLALVSFGVNEVDSSLFTHRYWPHALMAIPLMLTTFSFQTMVPSLTPYLKRHANALRITILGGTTITFVIYVSWLWLILGIVPVDGKGGLSEAFRLGHPPTQFLKEHVEGAWIGNIAEFFAFFAIVTSFLGIGLGLFDFLSDGLKIKEKGWGKLGLAALIIVPTLFFATQYERVFLVALESSGGVGDSIMNGMIPVMMVWVGRYHKGFSGPFRVFGGKIVLALVFAFFAFTLALQIFAYFS